MNQWFCILILLGVSTSTSAQIMLEDFEDATINYTVSDGEFFLAVRDYFSRIQLSQLGAEPDDGPYTGFNGTRFFGADDMDAPGGPGVATQQMTYNINITGFTDLKFSFLFAAGSNDASSGTMLTYYDPPDGVRVTAKIDGNPVQNIIAFESVSATLSNEDLRQDTDFDGVGDLPAGFKPSATFTAFNDIAITGTGSTLVLTIEFSSNGGDENYAIDDVKVTGTMATGPPIVATTTAPDVGEPEIGNTSYDVMVTYTDDNSLDASTFDVNDITVTGPGGPLTIIGAVPNIPGNGTPRIVTYTVTPPGGSWDAADNGLYTIAMIGSQVCDLDPQCVAADPSLATFNVNATNTVPTVSSFFADDVSIPEFGNTSYSFTIEYSDVGGVDVSTIGASDVTVTGPGGPLTVTAGAESSGLDGSPKTATYTVTPPGGDWDATDVGTYTIGVVGSEVLDIVGAAVAANSNVTSFEVFSNKLLNENFEDDILTYTTNDTFYLGPEDFFHRVPDRGPITPDDGAYTGFGGANFFGGEDLDADGGSAAKTLTFMVDIAGYENLQFMTLFGAGCNDPAGTGVRYDDDDGFRVRAQIDANPIQNLLFFEGEGGTNNYLAEDTDFNGVGDGTRPTTAMASYAKNITGTGAILVLTIEMQTNGSQECMAFDDVMILGDVAPGPPIASVTSAPDVGEPEIGQTSYSFDIIYSDDSFIDVSTIDNNDVTVTGPGGPLTVTGVTVDNPTDGNPRTATYTVTPPGGNWDMADNGKYFIGMVANEVGDGDAVQLFVAADPKLDSFNVAATNTPPIILTAFADDVSIPEFGNTAYSFIIEYSDVGGVDVSTIDASDVTVTGPGGPLTVTTGIETSGMDGSPKTATYTITPPGGSWDAGDVGTYTIGLVASQVADINGAFVAANPSVTTFQLFADKLLNENFEDAILTYNTTDTFYNGPEDYFHRVPAAGPITPDDGPYTGFNGQQFFGCEDTDAEGGAARKTISFSVNISGYDNLQFMTLFGAACNVASGIDVRYDDSDGYLAKYQIDAGAVMNLLAFEGEGGTNTFLAEDTDFDGVGDGTRPLNNMALYSRSITGTGNVLTLTIEMEADMSQECMAFDDVMITGTPIGPEMDVTGNGNLIPDGSDLAAATTTNGTDFGNFCVQGADSSITYTINNTGSDVLNLTSMPKVILSGHTTDFTVTAQPASPVAASGMTTFTIKFDPTTAGVRSATVTIANDDADENPYDFVIKGTGDGVPSSADAGPDQEVCSNMATLAANTPAVGTGEWSLVGGSGNISNTDDPDSGVTGLGSGDNVFRWTISNGTCADSIDEVTIVIDTTPPVAICQDVTVLLDESGNGSTTAAMVNNGSSDACGIATLELDQTDFTCNDIGPNAVIMTVTDNNGNTDTCHATVTVMGTVGNIIYVDKSAGTGGDGNTWATAFNDLQLGLTKAAQCDVVDSVLVAEGTYYPAVLARDSSFIIPDNTTVLGGFPAGGGALSERLPACHPTILSGDINMTQDSMGNAHHVIKTMDYSGTIKADGLIIEWGNAIANSHTGGGWWDGSDPNDNALLEINHCLFRNNYALLGGAFYTEDIGDVNIFNSEFYDDTASIRGGAIYIQPSNTSFNKVMTMENTLMHHNFAFTDGGAIAVSAPDFDLFVTNSTIADNMPNAINVNAAGGTIVIRNTIFWDNGTDDIIGNSPPQITYSNVKNISGTGNKSVNPMFVGPDDYHLQSGSPLKDMGLNSASTMATDLDGVQRIANVTVDMGAYENPLYCQDTTLQLDVAGMTPGYPVDSVVRATLTGNQIALVNGMLDVDTLEFACVDVGDTTVLFAIVDTTCATWDTLHQCDVVFTIQDTVRPMPVCQDITVHLDAAGTASIIAGDIDGGSNDACGIMSVSIPPTSFDCSDVGGSVPVTMTVTDNSFNQATCIANITVLDTIPPTASCQDITVQLDASGMGSATAAAVDNGSNDACGIMSLMLDKTDFTCADVGPNTVTLTVTDVNGNPSTCTATVTVEDNVAPVATCQDITVFLELSGTVTVTGEMVDNGSSDACGIASYTLDIMSFTCSDLGPNPVMLTVTDVNGNVAMCPATITVEDIPITSTINIVGMSPVCPGLQGVPYSIVPDPNVTSYQWTYSGAGATIIGNGTPNITINFSEGATAGNLTCEYFSACNPSGTIDVFPIVIGSPLACSLVTDCSIEDLVVLNFMISFPGAINLFKAANSVSSGLLDPPTIENGETVLFRAGQEINLMQNFEVELGALFSAEIESCFENFAPEEVLKRE